MGFLTLLSGIALTTGCTHEPALALAAAAQSVTPEGWCKTHGGIVQSYVTKNPEAPTVELPMCVFRSPDGTQILIGASTLAAEEATLAAVAYVNRPPMPNAGSAPNPAVAYCESLGGKSDPAGWTPTNRPTATPVPLCFFTDKSVIDAWGLAARASSTPRGPDLTPKFRYQTPTPGLSAAPRNTPPPATPSNADRTAPKITEPPVSDARPLPLP
ncbi:hypothetical protein Acor_04470 [Acrocarpospora corrugata]|uniref:Uncharacterized protein n=1 Tax=Acrocarpospora corrugata TaxID=35763 RepID=A0A5M3VNZ9_9ACTN|nr:hypothetical protein [Acrocarpospora corrugata]GER98385.1 hypothetical protein Acor_04470 [Acrocarpospora corrugata]